MIDKELLKKLRTMEVITRRRVSSLFAGEYHSAFKGRGIEFEEVRQYLPGDDIRDIDWNVSARTGDLFIKRFREERELTLFLMVDLSASGDFGSGVKSKKESAAEIAALLSFSALSNNDKVGLIGFTDEVELFIPASKGRSHVMSLLQRVLSFTPRQNGTDLNKALDYLSKIQKRQAIVFLISDFIHGDYKKKLRSLASHHDLVTLHLYDRRELELPAVGLIPLKDPESGSRIWVDSNKGAIRNQWRQFTEKRMDQLEKLHRKSGADHAALDVSGDWVAQLSRFFLKRQSRSQL